MRSFTMECCIPEDRFYPNGRPNRQPRWAMRCRYPLAMGSVASPVIAVGNGETWIGVASAGWFPTVLHYSGGEIHDMYMPSGLNLSAMAHGAFSSLYDDGEIQYIMPLLGVLQFGEEGFNLFNSKLIGNDVVPPHDIAVRGEIEEMPMLNSASMADFSGDGTRNSIIGTGGYLAHAFGVDDTEPPGWPKYTQKWITGTATVGDMDGDGLLEVLLPTYEGWLYAWETTADACPDGVPNSDWPRFHHDPHNTGYYGADVLPPARITDLEITPTDDGNLEAKFTAPGDDWFCGRALEYEVRVSGDMSADLSDVEQFREATIINWNGPPQDPGSPESFIIKGTGIKHAAIQTIDEAGNLSRISNDAANLPDDDDDNDDDAGGGDDDDDDACCG